MKKSANKLKSICFTLVTLFVFLIIPQMASAATTPDGFEYLTSGANAIITSYAGLGGNISIPETINDGANNYTVMSIGNSAFKDNVRINSVSVPDSVTSMGTYAFSGCINLTSVVIGNGLTSISEGAFNNCKDLGNLVIGNKVTSIGKWAFINCSRLTSVTIPDGVTFIGYSAFEGCSSLTSVTIPESVTSLGDSVFYDCTSLINVTIPNRVTSIGWMAFWNCRSLTSVVIGNRVTSIGHGAFYCCISLTSVTIPNSVTKIEGWAFKSCVKLTEAKFFGNAPAMGDVVSDSSTVFGSCASNFKVYYLYGKSGFTFPWHGYPTEPFYIMTYSGNGNTSGVVPVDSVTYLQGAIAKILGNSGSLTKTNYAFGGWNTKADGNGINYATGANFIMGSANANLYVKWVDTQPIEDFITRFYQLCLGRTPDANGLDYWINKLLNGEQTGADISQGFIFSQEFLNKNLSDDAFLDVMYQAFFNRAADSEGKSYWLSQMAIGKSSLYVLAQFVDSSEFTGICNEYGITKGSIDLSDEQIVSFVTRFYRLCLEREPDAGGLNDWVNKLKSGELTGANLAQGFVFSNEFTNKNLSNTEFVNVMYRVFFSREADGGGLTYWQSELTSGKSRLQVLAGFVESNEFAALCNDYGIEVGAINY